MFQTDTLQCKRLNLCSSFSERTPDMLTSFLITTQKSKLCIDRPDSSIVGQYTEREPKPVSSSKLSPYFQVHLRIFNSQKKSLIIFCQCVAFLHSHAFTSFFFPPQRTNKNSSQLLHSWADICLLAASVLRLIGLGLGCPWLCDGAVTCTPTVNGDIWRRPSAEAKGNIRDASVPPLYFPAQRRGGCCPTAALYFGLHTASAPFPVRPHSPGSSAETPPALLEIRRP